MNKCHVLKELSGYLDNQLNNAKKQHVEEHLRDCRQCQEELARLRAVSESLKAWQAPEVNADFDVRVRNKIVSRELERGAVKMKNKTWAILVPSSAIAGILLFVFLGGFLQTYVKRGFQGNYKVYNEKPVRVNIDREYDKITFLAMDGINNSRGDGSSSYMKVGSSSPQYQVGKGEFLSNIDSANSRVSNGISSWGKRGDISSVADGSIGAKPASESINYEVNPYGQGQVIVIQPSLPATGVGEKIIRTAQVQLEVTDGQDVYKKAAQVCQELGGYLSASNFYKDAEGREAGMITMRIPKDKFLTALDKLGTLGKVKNMNTDSQDVAQEYSNLQSRLDAAMVVYNKMLEALNKRQVNIPEAMRLESELTPVLQRVQDLKNQIEALNNAISFTTIRLSFYEPQVSEKVLKESTRFIQDGLITAKINAVKLFAKAIPAVIVLGFWLVVAVVLAFLLKAVIVKLFKRG